MGTLGAGTTGAGAAVGVRFACTRPEKTEEPEMRDAE